MIERYFAAAAKDDLWFVADSKKNDANVTATYIPALRGTEALIHRDLAQTIANVANIIEAKHAST